MTATNHALTGALIAIIVKKPELALPLAFLSHFALDSIPHFGVEAGDVFKRNVTRIFRTVLISDIILTIIMFFVVMTLVQQHRLLVGACMVLGTSPDMVWGVRFFREIATRKFRPTKDLFSRFHLFVQWSETPQGIFVELIWFIGVLALIIDYK